MAYVERVEHAHHAEVLFRLEQRLGLVVAVEVGKHNLDLGVQLFGRSNPAEKAGVKSQDILLDISGKPVNVRFPEEIAAARKMIADLPIGSIAILTIKRDKQTMTLNAKTEKLQGAVGEEKEFKTWGLSVRELTRTYANEAQLDDTQGVVVTTESQGYAAAKAELAPGDVIRTINRQPVTDMDEFSKLYDVSVAKKSKVVVLEVQHGRGRRTAVMKVNYDE